MATPTLASPAHLVRGLVTPAASGLFGAIATLMAALVAFVRRRTRPAFPRMSDDWLRALDRDIRRDLEPWG